MIQHIVAESLAAIDERRQIAPFTKRFAGFSVDDAYAVTALMRTLRERRGDRVVGRKIGFTNRAIWKQYGVSEPIWGYIYDTTLEELGTAQKRFSLSHLSQPQIEPEIVFKFRDAPRPGMTPQELLGAIEWVAHGFEIVQSPFPDWKFSVADTIAGNGLHGALLLGAARLAPYPPERFIWSLSSFGIDLKRGSHIVDRGVAANVLDGPLQATLHLVDLLERDAHNPQIRPGEIVTTGTLTRAFPVAAGEEWSTTLHMIPLGGLSVYFR